MKKSLTWRFWLEAGMAAITGSLFVLTLVTEEWIEILFGVEPDGGDGSLEWFVVAVLFAVTLTLVIMAQNEWRRIRVAIN